MTKDKKPTDYLKIIIFILIFIFLLISIPAAISVFYKAPLKIASPVSTEPTTIIIPGTISTVQQK
ncbi:MAG: hypothetical protein WCP18_00150 [bacterium]